jgi:hypothetical protein
VRVTKPPDSSLLQEATYLEYANLLMIIDEGIANTKSRAWDPRVLRLLMEEIG